MEQTFETVGIDLLLLAVGKMYLERGERWTATLQDDFLIDDPLTPSSLLEYLMGSRKARLQ